MNGDCPYKKFDRRGFLGTGGLLGVGLLAAGCNSDRLLEADLDIRGMT